MQMFLPKFASAGKNGKRKTEFPLHPTPSTLHLFCLRQKKLRSIVRIFSCGNASAESLFAVLCSVRPSVKTLFSYEKIKGFAKLAGTPCRFGRKAGTRNREAHLALNGARDLSGDGTGGAFFCAGAAAPRYCFSASSTSTCKGASSRTISFVAGTVRALKSSVSSA